jgi:peptidoglycan/LPS O-acetylase OafA/YrhL
MNNSPLTIVQSLLFLPVSQHPPYGSFLPIIVVGWTLNIELLFYLILTTALLLPKFTYSVVTVTILALVCLGTYFSATAPVLAYYLGNPLMLEFLFGIGIGFVYEHDIRIGLSLAIAGSSISAVALTMAPAREGFERVIYWGIPCAIIVAMAALGPQPTAKPLIKTLTTAGEVSYPLYVTHIIPAVIMWQLGLPAWAIFLTAIATAIVVRFAIDRPITALLRYRDHPSWRNGRQQESVL